MSYLARFRGDTHHTDPIGICYECGDPVTSYDGTFEDADNIWCAYCADAHLPRCPLCEATHRDREAILTHLQEDHDVSGYRAELLFDKPYALALYEEGKP